MSKAKGSRTFVCLVDNYRRPSRRRNTAGRYLVGAKDEKEAKELLQKAVKFGSVQVYYEVEKETGDDKFLTRGQIQRVFSGLNLNTGEEQTVYECPRKATDPISN